MQKKSALRVALVVPHIFLHRDILDKVIFSPGELALSLASGLQKEGVAVTLFTPGPTATKIPQINADLSYFQAELDMRGDSYLELLKKHPFTFVSLARQVQSELVADAIKRANNGKFDIVHVYGNEEDIALPMATFCNVPIVFTHHDPYNFLAKYRSVFPKYKHLNWISISLAQRASMPPDTNWVGNTYHGLDKSKWEAGYKAKNYIAYLGRIIEPKGVHLAIKAVKTYNQANTRDPLTLKIAGKHYGSSSKDAYWQKMIQPELSGHIKYEGFISDLRAKQTFLRNARALIIPSTFAEPFGMVMIEALACGTPVIGLRSGAIPEVITHSKTGLIVDKHLKMTNPNGKEVIDEALVCDDFVASLTAIDSIRRHDCRRSFEANFTLDNMIKKHIDVYMQLTK